MVVVETGMLRSPLEKNAVHLTLSIERCSFSGRFGSSNRKISLVSQEFQRNPAGLLCLRNCVSEQQRFEPSEQFWHYTERQCDTCSSRPSAICIRNGLDGGDWSGFVNPLMPGAVFRHIAPQFRNVPTVHCCIFPGPEVIAGRSTLSSNVRLKPMGSSSCGTYNFSN
jgi:hypothetical protein